MSDEVAGGDQPFDLERLQALIELMAKHDVTEVSLRRGDVKWHVRRGPQEGMQMVPVAVNPAGAASAAAVQSDEQPAAQETGLVIKSPTVGTFYAAPNPDDSPFVKVGVQVQPDTVVCIVEAMKVFNQIPAEVSGTIAEVLVNNGDPVEFGQPLFRVHPG